jgi:hypothetical protein
VKGRPFRKSGALLLSGEDGVGRSLCDLQTLLLSLP